MTNSRFIGLLFFNALFFLFSFASLAQDTMPSIKNLSDKEIEENINATCQTGDFDAGLKLTNDILAEIEQEIGKDNIRYALFLKMKSIVFTKKGALKEAKKYLLESYELIKKHSVPNDSLYIITMGSLADLYSDLSEYKKAEFFYLKTIKGYNKLPHIDTAFYAGMFNNLAIVYNNMGKYEEGIEAIKEATRLIQAYFTKEEAAPYTAYLKNNLANIYIALGRYKEALSLLFEVVDIRKELNPDNPRDPTALNNIALIYDQLNEFDLAEQYYLEVLHLWEVNLGKNHPHYATTLNNLSFLYQNTEAYEKAEKFALEAVAIQGKIGKERIPYGIALNNLGALYTKAKRYSEALKYLYEAKAIWEQTLGYKHLNYAASLQLLADHYLAINSLDTAYAFVIKGLVANSPNFELIFPNLLPSSPDSLESLLLNFHVHISKKDFFDKLPQLDFFSANGGSNSLESITDIFKAKYLLTKEAIALKDFFLVTKVGIKVNGKLRNTLSLEDDKKPLIQKNNYFTKYGVYAAHKISTSLFLSEAFSFAEQNKSIHLAQALRGNRAQVLGELPDSLVLKEVALNSKKNRLKKELYEATSQEEKSALNQETQEYNIAQNQFIETLKEHYPKYYNYKYNNITAKASDIQANLDDKSLFLEYFTPDYDSVFYLFAITKTTIKLISVNINKTTLEEKTKAFRTLLTNSKTTSNSSKDFYQEYVKYAHWFYQNTIKEALENTNIENLIIVTDGELGGLAFETFLVDLPADSNTVNYKNLHYLLNDYNISYNYSATLWSQNKQLAKRKNNNRMLACAASYGNQNDTIVRELRGKYWGAIRNNLSPLTATESEIKELSELFYGTFLTGNEANESFFKKEAAQYGVIHLAMHGRTHKRLPILSSLAFSENLDPQEDNFLQAYEISKMNLNAELIVLSACETGSGIYEEGEGILSLSRSFMYAGVPSLVVSLWNAHDATTAYIMQMYYHNLAQGLRKDKALRLAKLAYLKEAEEHIAHPIYWAPFIQIGDTQSIQIQTKNDAFWWYIGGGSLLALLGIFFFSRKLRKA